MPINEARGDTIRYERLTWTEKLKVWSTHDV